MGDSTIYSYRDLKVWQQAMELAKVCYELTRGFPRDELFGMTSQIRRSAASIPANIAEGNGRENRGDYIHSLRIAQGSFKELDTHLLLSEQIGLTSPEPVQLILGRCETVGKMLRALIRSLQKGKVAG